MKQLIRALALVCVLCSGAYAQRYRSAGFCEQGNQKVVTNGQSSTNKVMASYPQCTIAVYLTGTTTLATLYSNTGGTPLANPFVANNYGYYYFYVKTGVYDLTYSGGGLPAPWTNAAVRVGGSGSVSGVPISSFGCVGDGVTDDTVCVQNAINALEGSGQTLGVDGGSTYCVTSLSITGAISIIGTGGSGGFTRCGTIGNGLGMFDITGSNVTLAGFNVEGKTTTAQVTINYASVPAVNANALTANTSIWIHAPSTYITVNGLTINHTGGYAGFVDATTGNNAHIQFINNTVTNSRSSLCGTPGDYTYGCWTGGFLWMNLSPTSGSPNTYNNVDLLFENNRMLRVTGNGIWGHAANVCTTPANNCQNTGVSIINNYFEDMGLDAIQMQNVNGGVVSGNYGKRIGYVAYNFSTPASDVTYGVPKWQPANGTFLLYFSVPAVFIDASALTTGIVYADNDVDAINGGYMDGDGVGSSTVRLGTATSCHYSVDPHAASSSCGPGSNGTNYAFGWNSGNSAGSAYADINMNISGGQLNGFGGGAVKLYGCSNCKLSGVSINHPNNASYTPISYGPFTINSTTFYPTNMQINGNTAFWSPSTGAVVSEDPTYAAFTSAVVNYVFDNRCIGTSGVACYQMAKDKNSSTTTGAINFSSVTNSACPDTSTPDCIIESRWQTEGVNGGSYSAKLYANVAGTGQFLFSCSLSDCFVPSTNVLHLGITPFSVAPLSLGIENTIKSGSITGVNNLSEINFNRYPISSQFQGPGRSTIQGLVGSLSTPPSQAGPGLNTGSYTSGIAATGSAGQTCLLSSFNGGGSGATASIALTGTNTIAGGTALLVSSLGNGYTSSPTSATASNGTATCSGTAVVATTTTYVSMNQGGQRGAATGTSGYTTCGRTDVDCVGVYGWSYATTALNNHTGNDTSIWGANFGVNNTAAPYPYADGYGFPVGTIFGAEINVNIVKDGSGNLPWHAAGIWINGASTACATDICSGVYVNPIGYFSNPTVPWAVAFDSSTGAALIGLRLSPVASGSNQNSQGIQLISVTSGNSVEVSNIYNDVTGALELQAASGNVILPGQGFVMNNVSGPVMLIGNQTTNNSPYLRFYGGSGAQGSDIYLTGGTQTGTPDKGTLNIAAGLVNFSGGLTKTASITYSTLTGITPILGEEVVVSNANTNTWGAIISGSGTYAVKAFYDGTNWTVIGK